MERIGETVRHHADADRRCETTSRAERTAPTAISAMATERKSHVRAQMAVEVREPSQRLEHKQTRRREGNAHRSSPTPQRSEYAHGRPSEQAKSDEIGTAGKGEP